MADPIALQIAEALELRLADILIANGYNTDAGNQVYLGFRQINPDEVASGPALLVYELDDEPREDDADFCQEMIVDLNFQVEGIQAFGTDPTSEVLGLLWQDISQAVFLPADKNLGGLALSVRRGPRTFAYPEDGAATIAVRQIVTVTYAETYGDP